MKRLLALMLCAAAAAVFCCGGSVFAAAWEQSAREGMTVSAEEFGAYGMDDEDDRAALQAALRYARDNASASSPVTVTLGDGIYYVSDSVLIYSHTRLMLSDNAVLCFRDSPEGIILQGGDASVADYDTLTDIVISGGIWKGNASQTGAHTELIGLKSASNVTISGLKMEDSSDHFIMLTGVSNAVVRDCCFRQYVPISRIDQFVREAVHIDFLPLSDDNLFPSRNITVENCVFDNVASGIGTHHYGYGRYETNITVRGCTFYNLLCNCINSYSMAGLSVTGCTAWNCGCFLWMRGSRGSFDSISVSGCGQRCFLIHDGSSVRISNCVISHVGGGSDEKAFAVLAADSAVMVEDSSISDVAGTAVRVKNSDMLSVISGNIITRADAQGIFASDTAVCIKDNTVSQCEGIWTESAESEITENEINNCMYGIADHCGHSHIFRNRISQTYDYGIKITGTEEKNGRSVVEGNAIISSGRENVRIGTKCSDCLVRNNNIGLPFAFSYSKWSDLTVFGNGEEPPPAAPVVNCSSDGGSVLLNWEKVSGAAYYAVCEVNMDDGSLTRLHVTKKLQCRLDDSAAGQGRTFLVLSCAADGTPCFYTVPTNSVKTGGRTKRRRQLSLPIDRSLLSGQATGQIKVFSQSGDTAAIRDGIVSLSAAAEGDDLRFRWYFKKTGMLGWSLLKEHHELWEYVIADASWNGAQLFCVVRDGQGGRYRTKPVAITVRTPLRIVSEPADVITHSGEVVRFSVKAAGKGRLQYRWYYKKAEAADWSIWKNHSEPTLLAAANDSWQGMQVKCVISDDSGDSVETRTASISIEQRIG